MTPKSGPIVLIRFGILNADTGKWEHTEAPRYDLLDPELLATAMEQIILDDIDFGDNAGREFGVMPEQCSGDDCPFDLSEIEDGHPGIRKRKGYC
jgi:hypothetical protein